MTHTPQVAKLADVAEARLPWRAPSLREFGTIQALTANGFMSCNKDGGGAKPNSCPP